MRTYTHPRDTGLALARTVGKKRRKDAWKIDAVAKAAPHELDNASEDMVRTAVQGVIESHGAVYITFEDRELNWLYRMADKHHQAASLLATLKDFPDFLILRKVPSEQFTRALPLELKRKKKSDGGRPGQRRLAEAIGGTIAIGFEPANAAMKAFFA